MIYLAYGVILLCAAGTAYYGYLQGGITFYTAVAGATCIIYCVFLDFKKRRQEKEAELAKQKKKKKK